MTQSTKLSSRNDVWILEKWIKKDKKMKIQRQSEQSEESCPPLLKGGGQTKWGRRIFLKKIQTTLQHKKSKWKKEK